MNNQTIYWVWIQQVIGYSSHKISKITENYSFPEDFYHAAFEEKLRVGRFNADETKRLKNMSLEMAANIVQQCKRSDITIIGYGDELYPESLRNIYAPPAVIYLRGQPESLTKTLNIAVVGTRSATTYGKEHAYTMAYEFAKSGVCVVSGGALGIDTQAHKGVVAAGGMTVCVLGGGHDCGYLKEYNYLKRSIAVNGAVISEYPPSMKPSRYTFPQRNRIISGLSKGVVVVEAGKSSGSLITVNFALEQGKDIFAIPGDVSNPYSDGVNGLIRSGAKPVATAADVLEEYIDPDTKQFINLGESHITGNTGKNPEEIAVQMNFDQYIDMTLHEMNETNSDGLDQKSKTKLVQRALKSPPGNSDETRRDTKPPKKSRRVTKTDKHVDRCEKDKIVAVSENNAQKEKSEIVEDIPEDISENAVKMLTALSDGALHIDAVAEKTGLPISAVHAAATELEMNDLVEPLEGRRYKRK